MSIPNNLGAHVALVPLTKQWHKNGKPLPANDESPVPYQFFEGGDVTHTLPRPTVNREPDAKPQKVRPQVLNPMDFMKGGSL